MSELLLDAAGRRRSLARLPRCRKSTACRPPRNKEMRYPADPPTIEEFVTVMRRRTRDADRCLCTAARAPRGRLTVGSARLFGGDLR